MLLGIVLIKELPSVWEFVRETRGCEICGFGNDFVMRYKFSFSIE